MKKTEPTPCSPLKQLRRLQTTLHGLISTLGETDYRARFHPDLSPAGWHLGHTVFIENLWIREVILENDPLPFYQHDLYLPQNTGKSVRAKYLPPKAVLIENCSTIQRENFEMLNDPPAALATHRMMQDDYLPMFLAQHHAMHLETLHMCLTERQLQKEERHHYSPKTRLVAQKPRLNPVAFAAEKFEIGTNNADCLDNERPRHKKPLSAFTLNATTVSNAEFLGFMESDGYTNPAWWHPAGWRWLRTSRAKAPHHWLRDENGAWFGADSHGYHDLEATAPVYGLNHHEACAFARYANARLPHEAEWEIAHQQLFRHRPPPATDYRVWEWCSNSFYPYPGFKPYPYKEYSVPWFDNGHYSLRGYSRYTDKVLRRPTFRNFYTADKRHIFAGIRLAAS